MARTYHQLLPYVFKRFSVLKAPVTLLPTIKHYLHRNPLRQSDKPALFTMNILPPMMTVWHHFAKRALGDAVDIVIFDCSGKLDPSEFPGARVQKFLNLYAATKSDEFLYHIAKHRKIGWLCDDDVFFLNGDVLSILKREMAVPNTASVSFMPRTWWNFAIDGKTYEPSGSYCLALNREMYVDREKLSLAPAEGNTHPSPTGRGKRRYDTFDRANELLIRKGYRCAIVPEQERKRCIAAFSGMSGAVMLLHYFKRPEQVLTYFKTPSDTQWASSSMLFGLLSSMLAIETIQDCYEKIKGHRYPLPSLPSRKDLEALRQSKTPLLPPERSFGWIDEVSEKLLSNL